MSEEVVEVKKEGLHITENISKATEVAFCFDTTGSMASCIDSVRKNMEKCVEEMFELVPDLKIGMISHGDYCDGDHCYAVLPLTNDKAKIYDFIRNTPNTSGGDEDECYELALNLAKGLGWSDKKGGKSLVMFGDSPPHDIDYGMNKDRLDWRKELDDLKAVGIDVYPVQCMYSQGRSRANDFWTAIAEVHGTPLEKLNDTYDAANAITGYACASGGSSSFAAYEKKLAACSLEGLTEATTLRNAVLRDYSVKNDV